MKFLVESGLSVDATDSKMNTALSVICQEKAKDDSSAFVAYLLDRGASPHHLNGAGKTPFNILRSVYEALEPQQPSPEIKAIELLLEKGADPKREDTKLMFFKACKRGDVAFIQLFSRFKVDFNARDIRGMSGLILAIINERPLSFIQELVERGANVNIRDNAKRTPLFWRQYKISKAKSSSDPLCDFLISKGAKT